jgi:Carboxypeptidase regulatory-like domain
MAFERRLIITFMSSIWLIAPAVVSAQTSGIAGVVKDVTGAMLPGVTVTAESAALIEKVRTAVTDGQGQYKIVSLRPGIYSVTFTLQGFSTTRREGIELVTDFTATIDADMRVGEVEETITVSGQSPVVDVQNTAVRNIIPRDVLDEIPTARASASIMALTPGVVPETGTPYQDVGGSMGEQTVRSLIHGSRGNDFRQLVDGIDINLAWGPGSYRIFQPVSESAEEISVKLGGGTAEHSTGGIMVDFIPKDGGNRFSGNFLANFANRDLQGTNFSDEQLARGLSPVNISRVKELWDLSGHVGGPLKRDRVWFFSAHRKWVTNKTLATTFYNSTQESWLYTPDMSRPGIRDWDNYTSNIRITWQASTQDKFRLSYDHQYRCDCHTELTSTFAPEAINRQVYQPNEVFMATWTRSVGNRLLFEAGGLGAIYTIDLQPQPEAFDKISVLELSNNFRYRAASVFYPLRDRHVNSRFSTSYVTGSHAFKTGMNWRTLWYEEPRRVNGDVNYTFRNGRPTQVTQWATPLHYKERMKADLGLYAQDQWTIKNVTLNLGLRFDYINAWVPEQQMGAGPFVPARSFASVECVPCMMDLSPRLSAAYNLFGTGKTALKVSWGRYVEGVGTLLARQVNPLTTTVATANRAWGDVNGDYVPQEEELGPLSNVNFGKQVVGTRFTDEVLNGWGTRSYSWQGSASIAHELRPGVGVSFGYFRTSWHNFTVTDNLAVSSQDYDQYCITAPVDQRLPDGGGYPICGLYDIKPEKFGLSDNLVVPTSRFGNRTEVYDGVDLTLNARLPGGAFVGGGLSSGRTATDNCVVVDSPDQRYCQVTPPFSTQAKFHASYPLPWDFQVSGVVQTNPGIPISASYVATSAEIAQSLGRPLSGGVQTVTISNLFEPQTMFEGRHHQLDMRLAKVFKLRRATIQGRFDVYNVFNASPILFINSRYGPAWLTPGAILDARMAKFEVQVKF